MTRAKADAVALSFCGPSAKIFEPFESAAAKLPLTLQNREAQQLRGKAFQNKDLPPNEYTFLKPLCGFGGRQITAAFIVAVGDGLD
jgi:hypothetical protein